MNAISSQFNLFSLFSSRVFGWSRWVWSSVCLWIFCFALVLSCIAFFKKMESSTLFKLLLVAKNINKSGVCFV